jgi:hypothetical protein
MRIISRMPLRSSLSFLFVAALAAGCSHESAPLPPVEQNLRHIGAAYDKAAKKAGHPPRNIDELKATLQRFGDPDAILVSPNDGQPFVIHWDVQMYRPGPKGAFPIVAHEVVGVDGKKYVLDNMLTIHQMTEAELDQALKTNKQQP